MNIEDVIKSLISNGEDCQAAKNTEKEFPDFIEGVLKELFGDKVKFEKVEEDIDPHAILKKAAKKEVEDKNLELDDDELDVMNVVTEDEMEIVKHVVRKIAQKHKKELPLEGIYSAVAAHLAKQSDKILSYKQKARYEAQKEAKLKSETMSKFNDFTQSLSDEERDALNDMLKNI